MPIYAGATLHPIGALVLAAFFCVVKIAVARRRPSDDRYRCCAGFAGSPYGDRRMLSVSSRISVPASHAPPATARPTKSPLCNWRTETLTESTSCPLRLVNVPATLRFGGRIRAVTIAEAGRSVRFLRQSGMAGRERSGGRLLAGSVPRSRRVAGRQRGSSPLGNALRNALRRAPGAFSVRNDSLWWP